MKHFFIKLFNSCLNIHFDGSTRLVKNSIPDRRPWSLSTYKQRTDMGTLEVLSMTFPLHTSTQYSKVHFTVFSLQIATDNLQVEVRDLKKAASPSHCFQTIDQVSRNFFFNFFETQNNNQRLSKWMGLIQGGSENRTFKYRNHSLIKLTPEEQPSKITKTFIVHSSDLENFSQTKNKSISLSHLCN